MTSFTIPSGSTESIGTLRCRFLCGIYMLFTILLNALREIYAFPLRPLINYIGAAFPKASLLGPNKELTNNMELNGSGRSP